MRTQANRKIQSQRHPVCCTEVPRLPLDVPLGAWAPCSPGLELALPWVMESGSTFVALEGFPCILSSTTFSFLLSGNSQWSPQLGPHPSARLKLLCDYMAFSLWRHYVVDILLGPEPHVSGPRAPPHTSTQPTPLPEGPVTRSGSGQWPESTLFLGPGSSKLVWTMKHSPQIYPHTWPGHESYNLNILSCPCMQPSVGENFVPGCESRHCLPKEKGKGTISTCKRQQLTNVSRWWCPETHPVRWHLRAWTIAQNMFLREKHTLIFTFIEFCH